MEIFNNYIVQLGAIGMMIAGLVWFSRTMFKYVMDELKKSSDENKQLEIEFRDYLIQRSKEQLDLIEKNTQAFTRLISFLESGFAGYFKERTKAQKELNSELKSMVNEIAKNLKK